MTHVRRSALALLILAAAGCSFIGTPRDTVASASAGTRSEPASAKVAIASQYGQLPLHFERNEGQTDSRVDYLAHGRGYKLFLTSNEAVLTLQRSVGKTAVRAEGPAVIRARLVGANADATAIGEELFPGKTNYFVGSDRSKWRTDIPQFGRVTYRAVWPGVDLTYYGTSQGELEYDFVVKPGADPDLIRVNYDGVEKISIDEQGNLVLRTTNGELLHRAPVIYQDIRGERKRIEGRFIIGTDQHVGFQLASYDRSLPVVIDPSLAYSTYLGGTSGDNASAIAIDTMGNAYVTGSTGSSNFPTLGAFQGDQTSFDVFVTKLSANGTSLIYSTYIGGDTSDEARGIAVDASGTAYITGYTSSTNFPTQNPYQTDQPGADAFVTRLSAGGSALLFSTYLGGGLDEYANDLAIDSGGNVYVVGWTPSTDFPTQGPYQGDQTLTDAFVTKLSPSGNTLVYSTYLGGDRNDYALDVAVDASGNAYVTGHTASSTFPTLSPYQPVIGNTCCIDDAFVTKLSVSGNSLVYSTYLGGNSSEAGQAIAIDGSGNAYIAGSTSSSNFPTQGPYQGDQPGADAFVAKLSANGSSLLASTYLGGSDNDAAVDLAVDSLGNIYVCGNTRSTDFPMQSALDSTHGGGLTDAFATKLHASGSALAFSTYLGGNGAETANSVVVDGIGRMHLAGYTGSTNFPVLSAYQATAAGSDDAFIAKLNTVPLLFIGDTTVTEGNSGTLIASFPVTLDATSPATITVDYASSNGTATAGSDYQSVTGTLTFLSGETSKNIDVTISGDTAAEPDDTFVINLSNATGATISDGQGAGLILDDDNALPLLSIADKAAIEGNSGTSVWPLPVSLSYARGIAVTASYQTTNGTARAPGDYSTSSGTVTFPPWTTQANIAVSTAGDVMLETRETFSVTLSSPTNASIGDALGIVTINDDDSLPARTGDLAFDRAGHTTTLLTDGRVLLMSGTKPEIFDPATATWSVLPDAPVSFSGHAAAVLPNGRVMLSGGISDGGNRVSIFDSVTSQWSSAPLLNESRSGHTMTMLNDGRALMVGGYNRQSVETYTESGGNWTRGAAGSLSPVRTEHTATRLADGRVLVVGGWVSNGNSLGLADLFNPLNNTWTSTSPLTTGRYAHTATLLADGRVLVAGGYTTWSATSWTASCEIYDPVTGQWTSTGPLTEDRAEAVSALLGTGEVLVAGGEFPNYTDIEIYNPALGTWSSAGKLSIGRKRAAATMLTDGRILIAGGNGFQEENKGYTAELLDASAGVIRTSSSLNTARREHSATLLTDGRLLIVGGGDASYEVYDRNAGATGTWTRTAEPLANRREHTATLLPSGSVLVAGGGTGDYDGSSTTSLFTSGALTPATSMGTGRRGHSATLLADGRVLVAGGLNTFVTSNAQLFTGISWVSAGSMVTGRWRHTATRLQSGEVLVAGGQSTSISDFLRSAEIYDPLTNSWRAIAPMATRRTGHVAVALRDGRVLVAGGNDDACPAVASAEVYDPVRDTWSPVASMTAARSHATATLLWNGKVVVAGGQNCLSDLSDMEIWDPVANRWITANWSLSARHSHTAALLTTGEILFGGGRQTSGPTLAETALFDPTRFSSGQGPEITTVSTPIAYGTVVNIAGNRLRGASESSSGGTRSAATDLPVVEMRSVEHDQIIAVPRDGIASPPSGIAMSQLPSNLDAGWYYLQVVTSGVASSAKLVNVACSVKITSLTGPGSPVASGQAATFTVAAQGARRYQWQRCITGTCTQESEWSSIGGATTASYTTLPVTGADAGTRYRVVVSGNCASETSSSLLLNVADAAFPTAAVLYPAGGEYWLLSPTDGNPANTRVVTWSMSDDVRICRVDVRLLYSNDGGINYVPAPSGGGLPATFGPGGSCVYPGEATKSVTYTIPTSFPSGSSGSLYKIEVTVADQASPTKTTIVTSTNPFYIVQPNPDSVKTIILANTSRMIAKQSISGAEATLISGKLQELANHPRVQGLVVDLNAVTSINNLYVVWDADVSNATKANAVLFGAGGIHEYLRTSLLTAYTGVKNLVLVGDDRIIPMARMQDRTVLLPESAYANGTDLTATGSTVGRALAANKYLTDDPLTVLDAVGTGALDGNIFIPDLAIGRLVETPQEIVTTIATYISQDGILDLSLLNATTGHKVLITGYDFLSSVAKQMSKRWKSTLGISTPDNSSAPVDGSLIGGNWGLGSVAARTSALRTRFAGNGGARYGVMAIAGHATHYEEGVPGTDPFDIQGLSTADLYGPDACGTPTAGAVDLSGGVIYALGCHGGLSVPGSCRLDTTPPPPPDPPTLDLPQTMLRRGAVAYVANSGYGWALKHGIGYGARLSQIFTEQMTSGGTIAVGDAVKKSKQQYYMEAPRYDAYDEKSVMQWTLYGLPMYAVKTGIAAGSGGSTASINAGTNEQRLGGIRVKRQLEGAGVPVPKTSTEAMRAAPYALPSYLTQLNLSFDFTGPGVYQKYDSEGTLLPAGPGCPDVNGCYYTLNGLVDRGTGSADLPIQPYLIYDSRLAGTSQHGVLWKGGTYNEESGWKPVIAELVSNGGDGSNHGSTPRVSSIRPTSPRVVPGVDAPGCRTSDLEVNSVTVAVGEAVKPEASDAVYSITRRYRNLDLEVFYFNDRVTPGNNCDRNGPAVAAGPHGGQYHIYSGGTLNWAVPATDPSGVWRVLVVYNTNSVSGGQGTWVPLDLTNDAGTFRGNLTWNGSGRLTYVIQAVDNRGNVTFLEYVSAQPPSSGVALGVAKTMDAISSAVPASVVATATTATSVSVTWASSNGAVSYDIYRSSSGTNYTKIDSSPTLGYTDTTASANTAYLYAVRGIDSGATASAMSNPDLATTVIFTDPTLTGGATVIKAVHIAQLRMAIQAVATLAGQGSIGFTDPTLTSGVTRVKAAHLAELRTAMNSAREAIGLSAITFLDSPLSGIVIKRGHVEELRGGVR